ncbi:MmgE/PrpD family protein [Actinophytocola sp.]|uniref:MmgE/PrpD family protein n=1 Tax=Actinophytocola sp. TaxID=1872138 RepID=UPI003D6B73EE
MNTTASATRSVAEFVATGHTSVPAAEVEHAVSRLVFDTLVVMLCGRDEPLPRLVAKHQRSTGGPGRASAAERAHLLGVMAHIHDFDDYRALVGHPSAVLVPTMLAMHEKRPASTPDLVAAYTVGFEVLSRLARYSRGHYEHGFHTSATLGALGAACVASRLRSFTAPQVASALGIAASQASGLRGAFGSDLKAYQLGRAAAVGVDAVGLTTTGVVGPGDTLDGESGFLGAFFDDESAALARRHLAEIRETPTDELAVITTPPMAKPYPSCGGSHGAIDAALELHAALGQADIDSITSVRATVPPYYRNALRHRIPTTGLAGKFSLEYCVATALVRGSAGLTDFTDEAVTDPRVLRVADRVVRDYRPEMDDQVMRDLMPATLECAYDGGTVTRSVVRQSGGPGALLSDEQLITKARSNVEPNLSTLVDRVSAAFAADDVAAMLEAAMPALRRT